MSNVGAPLLVELSDDALIRLADFLRPVQWHRAIVTTWVTVPIGGTAQIATRAGFLTYLSMRAPGGTAQVSYYVGDPAAGQFVYGMTAAAAYDQAGIPLPGFAFADGLSVVNSAAATVAADIGAQWWEWCTCPQEVDHL